MRCPKCPRGTIRVMAASGTHGRHPLFCDNCFVFFKIDDRGFQGVPDVFPPECPIIEDDALTAHVRKGFSWQVAAKLWKFPTIPTFKAESAERRRFERERHEPRLPPR